VAARRARAGVLTRLGGGTALTPCRYHSGESSLLDVLDSERGLLGAELDQVQAQRAQLTATTDLFKSLGGGWDNAAEPAPVTR
jgi:outer membrane protein TolC